jgi:O-antigen biosynthesis protein WbqP
MISRIIALVLIVLLSPLFITISLLILIFDGFPIIYIQKNYGLNNKIFDLYKFRTMQQNTPELPTEEFSNASSYISKLGKILRKFSFDELPQFFNILKGDIHFIGPRPCMVKNEEIVKEMRQLKGVHKIKPGITGLAQVNGRDSNSYERKVELDYEYMKNANFIMDIKIVLKTFVAILFPKNIKH